MASTLLASSAKIMRGAIAKISTRTTVKYTEDIFKICLGKNRKNIHTNGINIHSEGKLNLVRFVSIF
jgi:hypothetical protein